MIPRGLYVVLTSVLLQCHALPAFAADPARSDKPASLVSDPVGFTDYLQMFLGLAFVLALIVGMAWLIRRMGNIQQAGHGALRVIGGLAVGQRERVVLLQVGETQLLVGLAPGQIRTLHVLDKPVTSGNGRPKQTVSFAERLHGVMKGKSV